MRHVVTWSMTIALVIVISGAVRAQDAVADSLGEDVAIEEVLEAHHLLMQAYAAADADLLMSLIDPSANLLIYHPRGNLRFRGLPDTRRGIEQMLARVGPSTWTQEAHVQAVVRGDVAWCTYFIAMEWDVSTEPIQARATEIWIRRAPGWRLVHGHWSEESPDR